MQDCLEVDSKICDAGALVNMLGPVNHRAFDDFAKNVAMIYIKNQLHSVKRTDIVWDQYFLDSLKKKNEKRS